MIICLAFQKFYAILKLDVVYGKSKGDMFI